MQHNDNGESGDLSRDLKPEDLKTAGTVKRRHLARLFKACCFVLALIVGIRVCLLSMHVKWQTQRMTTGESKGHRSTIECQYPETWICPKVSSNSTVAAEIYPKPISKFTKWCSQSIPLLRYLNTDNKFKSNIACAPPRTSSDPSMGSKEIIHLEYIFRTAFGATNIHVDAVGKEGGGESGEMFNRLQLEMHNPRTHEFTRILIVYRRRAKSAVKARDEFVYDNYGIWVHGPEATISAMRPTIDEIFRRVRLVEEK